MTEDEDDAPVEMVQTGPHTTVRADVARRLGLSVWAPEQEVRPAPTRGGLERMAEVVGAEADMGNPMTLPAAPAKPAQAVSAPKPSAAPPTQKRASKAPRRSMAEILADCPRAGPGPRRPQYHGASRGR